VSVTGTDQSVLLRRCDALMQSSFIRERKPPRDFPWPLAHPEPAELAAFYARCDGLVLTDGTTILGRASLVATTEWLKGDRALGWDDDLVVVGERADMVIVRDLDARQKRSGGGVLEAPHDALESFGRLAFGLVGYLEMRVGKTSSFDLVPEVAAREAAARRDARGLALALARPFYPGADRDFAYGALVLGSLYAKAGDEPSAKAAFLRSVDARVRGVSRGASKSETTAAWRACARAAIDAGADKLAAECAERAGSK